MATTGPQPSAKEKFLALLKAAAGNASWIKLTLGAHVGEDRTLKNIFVRPVSLRAGLRLSFTFRHATRDITKNFTTDEALVLLGKLIGGDFKTAHLFTTGQSVQLDAPEGRPARLTVGKPAHTAAASTGHDRKPQRSLSIEDAPWLHALGVTTAEGKVTKGMESKLRQIHKFTELLASLLTQAGLQHDAAKPLTVIDMGCGKGYLTFAVAEMLRRAAEVEAQVRGIESRGELVAACNRIAQENQFAHLTFEAGDIAGAALDSIDVLLALHACDTATDDAIARGIQAGASLIIVSPCCHKELRPKLRPPPALANALRHGILLERQAEFVTDALRAALLEWAGYETKVFEFIATEHTGKNLMIAAIKRPQPHRHDEPAERVRELAALYGIESQRLASHLNFSLPAKANRE